MQNISIFSVKHKMRLVLRFGTIHCITLKRQQKKNPLKMSQGNLHSNNFLS